MVHTVNTPEPAIQPITPETAERITPPLNKRSPWRALGHRNYALFFTGHGLSLCGTWMQSMALAWLVYRLSGSPFPLAPIRSYTFSAVPSGTRQTDGTRA